MAITSDSRLGSIIENYRLLSVLGTGSTSVVYLGQQLDDHHGLVAVKILSYQTTTLVADHASFRRRFLREAHAASKLRNEHIVPVLSYGDDDEMTYMIMPVIVGGTLGSLLADRLEPLPLSEIAGYLTQIASALDTAHQQGVVHRDVKPTNILLDEHRNVYLTDFGIARIFDSGDNALTREGPATLTRTGQVLGTPYYMAPEQVKGEPVTPATDIYALGVVLYQMVTGQVPFHGDTPLAVALQHLQETPSAPRLLRAELPAPIEDVIMRALAKEPRDRFSSAGAMAEAFHAGLATITTPDAGAAPSGIWPFATGFGARAVALDAADLPYTGRASSVRDGVADDRPSDPQDPLVGVDFDGYRIVRRVASTTTGNVYMTTRDDESAIYRLRTFAQLANLAPAERAAYPERFEEQALNLTALHHPNILPVTDFGIFRGTPYLVMPDPSGPSLSALVEHNDLLEFTTIATYVDQTAAALSHAHEQGILHLGLAANCIFARADGSVVVGDFAVRELAPQQDGQIQGSPLYVTSEACSPEQLLGNPTGAYTDVYALGAVLYHLLAGHPVFTGTTPDDIAQQHLHSSIPPLRRWRKDVPPGLENVLTRALSKEPEHRFQHPVELASAYRRVIGRGGAGASLTASTVGATSGQAAIAPMTSAAVSQTPTLASTPAPPTAPIGRADGVSGRAQPASTPPEPMRQLAPSPPAPPPPVKPAPPERGADRPGFLHRRFAKELIALVALVAIVGGTLGIFSLLQNRKTTQTSPPGGGTSAQTAQVFFADGQYGQGNTDALKIQIPSLPAPPQGSQYLAWLIDSQTQKALSLGILAQQADKSWSLSYSGNGSTGQPGTNLLSLGDAVEITQEQGSVSAPTGKVVLRGALPPKALAQIKYLLVSAPQTPKQEGYVVGLLQQAQALASQAGQLPSLMQPSLQITPHCAAQNILNILEGTSGPDYRQLGLACLDRKIFPTDDGVGLLGPTGYLTNVANYVVQAAKASDASKQIQLHSGHVVIATDDARKWLTTVQQDAIAIAVDNNFDPKLADEINRLAGIALSGQNIDNDETIDPVPNEAGVETAYEHSQKLIILPLVPPR
ncbi:MAG: serine/threonine protein kinase [Ktedonobacterales bacterium]|jgi:serine/threonine protein kinase|nr:MAG: serine/threonine protein kinase [Ktedonobacterales bacterium]